MADATLSTSTRFRPRTAASVPRPGRHRRPSAALQPGRRRQRFAHRRRHRLVAAAGAARAPARHRTSFRAPVLSAVSGLLRADPAALRRRTARGQPSAALRQYGRVSFPDAPPRWPPWAASPSWALRWAGSSLLWRYSPRRPASAWAAGCTRSRHRSSGSTSATSTRPSTAPNAQSRRTRPRPAARPRRLARPR